MSSEYQRIVSTIAKLEGKKRQVKIGDVREIIRCLVVIEAASRVVRAMNADMAFPADRGMVFEQLGNQASKIAERELKKQRREQAKKK